MRCKDSVEHDKQFHILYTGQVSKLFYSEDIVTYDLLELQSRVKPIISKYLWGVRSFRRALKTLEKSGAAVVQISIDIRCFVTIPHTGTCYTSFPLKDFRLNFNKISWKYPKKNSLNYLNNSQILCAATRNALWSLKLTSTLNSIFITMLSTCYIKHHLHNVLYGKGKERTKTYAAYTKNLYNKGWDVGCCSLFIWVTQKSYKPHLPTNKNICLKIKHILKWPTSSYRTDSRCKYHFLLSLTSGALKLGSILFIFPLGYPLCGPLSCK